MNALIRKNNTFRILFFSTFVFAGALFFFPPVFTYAANLFQDGFETGNLSHSENNIHWGDSANTSVSSTIKATGAYSLAFPFNGGSLGSDAWAEQRIELNQPYTELWVKYDLYIPSNYNHRVDSPSNNKFFALYRNPYTTPGFQVNLSTEPNGTGGSDLEIHYYKSGSEQSPLSVTSNIITSSDYGKWMNLIMHFKAPTGSSSNDGVVELWENGTLSFSRKDMASWGGSGQNYFDAAYILGWSNSGFSQTTTLYVDNVVLSTTPLTPSTALQGDINGDSTVNSLDWSIMNARWGTSDSAADLNHDGIVNSLDFSILNQNWGKTQ